MLKGMVAFIIKISNRWNHYCCLWNYRRKGVMFGKRSHFNNVVFGPYVNLAHHAEVSNCSIDTRTSIGRYSKVQYADIGKYCSISWDVTIGALSHPIHAISSHAFPYKKKFKLCRNNVSIKHERVIIGNDVWIGCGVIVMPGVHIGDGAIIGAGAVVTHDVQPYEIVAGIPARHQSWRFDEETRCDLLDLKWWDWDDEVIMANINLFSPENDLNIDITIVEKLRQVKSSNI